MGVELIISHSTDMNSESRYDIRMQLGGGSSIAKVSRVNEQNISEDGEENIMVVSKQLETNRLTKLFHPDHMYGGFFVKIKVKQDYTGITLAKAGETEDPMLAVKDHNVPGKKEGSTLYVSLHISIATLSSPNLRFEIDAII